MGITSVVGPVRQTAKGHKSPSFYDMPNEQFLAFASFTTTGTKKALALLCRHLYWLLEP
ncbi:Uu.00g000100.m01.CDS01, partial [Anthostomella pinea]